MDHEKGTTLKAEMAKKNLHIKQQQKTSVEPVSTIKAIQADYYETFSPLPSNLLSPRDYKSDFFSNESLNLSPTPSSFGDSLFGIRPFSFEHKTYKLFSNNDTTEQEDPLQCTLKQNTLAYHTLDKLQKTCGDQNPPCNTLYIGNIPAHTNEDELRTLFSTCQGYKRMIYRQKNQGPMCFVEFEDVPFAVYAIKHLQGHLLTQSGKNGIRLSFSKNSLFMKNNTSAFHLKRLGTALLADL